MREGVYKRILKIEDGFWRESKFKEKEEGKESPRKL